VGDCWSFMRDAGVAFARTVVAALPMAALLLAVMAAGSLVARCLTAPDAAREVCFEYCAERGYYVELAQDAFCQCGRRMSIVGGSECRAPGFGSQGGEPPEFNDRLPYEVPPLPNGKNPLVRPGETHVLELEVGR